MMIYLRDIKQKNDGKPHYSVGMYGGKFMPMHKGHLHCLDEAAKLCGRVYLIMFTGGFGERFVRKTDDRRILSEGFRWEQVMRAADMYDNVTPLWIDVSECITDDGKEDWDAETPLVLNACERFDAVFGSEPTAYAPYFERAYPWADYVVVDADRETVPISATKVRSMTESEARTWMV
jgi:HTH-type transcriptional repressor of NAD biosynthesis genes